MTDSQNERAHNEPHGKRRQRLVLLGAAAFAGVFSYWLLPDDLPEAPRRMAVIFVVALVLWVTEAIPLFATSLLVIGLQGWWLTGTDMPWNIEGVLSALSHPVIFIFLGGFILARAVQQERIDLQMAGLLLRAFGSRPAAVLAGVMVVTAVFSMWMSNTATTAMMVVLVLALTQQMPQDDRFGRGLTLSVPLAANIGGIGTPIGTPPNAIALAHLESVGYRITFLQWMAVTVPLLILALLALWLMLLLRYRPAAQHLALHVSEPFRLHWKALVVYATFFLTVACWLTSRWHGVPTAIVAILPVVVFTATGIVGRREFNGLDWHILVLIAGGIALGQGIVATELDLWLLAQLPLDTLTLPAVVVGGCVAALALSTVVSNTVAVAMLLPVAAAVAATVADVSSAAVVSVLVAITSSFAMALPISTPPNAIAYGTGRVSRRELFMVGGLAGIASTVIIIATGPVVVSTILAWF